MSSPYSSSAASSITQSGIQNTNTLVSGTKWGWGAGLAASLSYSFPWSASSTATFAGPVVSGSYTDYSTLNEPAASVHRGLNSTEQAAAAKALQAWGNVANISFSKVSDTATDVGDIRFGWTSAANSSSTGNQAWGWAYFPGSTWASSGDVWISTLLSSTSTNSWEQGAYNYQALLHELGHALGLKHPFEGGTTLPASLDNRLYTVMSYTMEPNNIYPSAGYVDGKYDWITYYIYAETPMVLDIAAIQYLYGANYSYNSGNDIYTFDTSKPFFKTLWDGGGTDTISAANFTLACTIDLTPGNYSSLKYPPPSNPAGKTVTYDGTNNLGIAYGCIIENAIGGRGNDTIIGNDADNQLTAGLGNDTISGGKGVDTAVYSGNSSAYMITYSASERKLTVSSSTEGTDTVSSVEFLSFSDKTVAVESITGDITAPSLLAFTSSATSASIPVASAITFTFDEAITRGVGNILLKDNTNNILKSYDVSTSARIAINGNTLSLDLTGDLSAAGAFYRIEIASGSITDSTGNSYSGITTETTIASSRGATLVGTDRNNILFGTSGADRIYGYKGDDYIDGGDGIDVEYLSEPLSAVKITATASGYTVTGSELTGVDTLANVERLQYADTMLALDTSANPGKVYRLYQAAFNRTPDTSGLGFWVNAVDNGASLVKDAAAGFINSPEFISLYGANPTDGEFVSLLYNNVLHRALDQGGYDFWTGSLAAGSTRPEVLYNFSESPENQTNVASVIANGITYKEWIG